MRANGFKHAVNVHEFRGRGGDAMPHHLLHVVVRRPTELEAVGLLRPEARYKMPPMSLWKRLFYKPDPDDPNLEIELDVEVVDADPIHEFALNDLVAHSGVRHALQRLSPHHSDVHLGFIEEAVKVERLLGEPLPEGDEVLRWLFLVSLYRDRLKL